MTSKRPVMRTDHKGLKINIQSVKGYVAFIEWDKDFSSGDGSIHKSIYEALADAKSAIDKTLKKSDETRH
jgi:hypothetical protein